VGSYRTPFALLIAVAITVLGSVVVPLPAWAEDCTYPFGTAPGALQVPRKARDKDLVCVPQSVANTVKSENADSAAGIGHTPGSNGCVSGRVWREAFDGDSVCVSPARRSETWQQNLKAGVGSTGGQIKADPALLSAVNDARLHPEKYPPHGNTDLGNGVKAKMTACPKPLGESWALDNAAFTHNKHIASVSQAVLAQDQYNPHRNPPPGGPLSWAPWTGQPPPPIDPRVGPIVQSGYDRKTGEIVAYGQPTAALAVQAWMQDDEKSKWGHRNNILDCDFTDAGAAHLVGGPYPHYWTVDFGAH
jgi:hypothetical protein